MLTFFQSYQVYMLAMCGLLCAFLGACAFTISFRSRRKKMALFGLELSTAVLLIADAFAYIYRGNTSTLGFWAVRISNFLVYAMIYCILYFFNSYLTSILMGKGKYLKLPKILLTCYIIPSISLSLLVISQFNGMFYYFDENNYYHRGSAFILGYVLPVIVFLLQLTIILQSYKMINRKLFITLILFITIPIVAGIVQFSVYGISLMNLAIGISAIAVFWLSLIDLNSELVKSANTDITGLPNTYGYMAEIERIKQSSDITKYNAYYFDIVRMSHINNRYGKDTGDEVLKHYIDYIRVYLDKDEVLGRLGGNFFVALVKKSNTEKFLNLIHDIPVEIKVKNEKETVHVAAVAGCYEITKKNIEAGQIMGYISSAVTYAKNVARKPYVFLDDTLEQKIAEARFLEDDIQDALKKREFIPYYQPKVNYESRRLCGAEALVRWKHNGELVPPAVFVPNMERTGRICELDFLMLDQVCRDIKYWLEKGYKAVRVSVNFSRRNLSNPRLAEEINEIVEKYKVSKNLIQIEITETFDEFPMERLKELVEKLRSFGFTVAIDDFGTGSSSIKLLKEVPFDVLKIDKSFVDYTNEKERRLLSYIISMASVINIDTIAEGIEDEERLEAIGEMGCEEIQGYVFDKPLPKDEFENRIQHKLYQKKSEWD